MKNFIQIFFSLILISSCSSPTESIGEAELYQYERDLARLRGHLSKPALNMDYIKEQSISLIDQAVPILEAFAAKYPECEEVITSILSQRNKMLDMALEDIERDFHEGEALPESSLRCYNPKELVVHPATVYLLTESDETGERLLSMQAELDELDSHFGLFREDMLKD